MPDLVIDASVAVLALTGTTEDAQSVRKRIVEATCHAPHLLDAEVGRVLRRLERIGAVSDEEARTALGALPHLIDHRYPHTGRLSGLTWDLRHSVTFYDGLYVALATALDVPLLTSDEKLTKSASLPCAVELI
ncbi:VapC toxin family PIN domain ribonuclease [Actinosynnema sp. ALI-1.44]|uniref:type II toxin-antitoxin system VapC family toxin n=1 Tax=Actinosynnema sp. ALI-1.44 TaxID=1933779 RepID=UPI00097BD9C5|nr:type II toxin-antitoxin system VapC family toxin [Actinosynnema sp. ALI-1.44]ONI70489.1 VapC toxin family PIN domain ribonuclease [Actinosynnema sp. ALI-1.44]